ncbi:MAG: DUF190 domain-containing protein [Chlamydiota bacterium]
MKGFSLKFYTYECQKYNGLLVHEWLLEFAKKNKVQGGSAFRAIAGYGRHGIMHEEHFLELASNVPIEVVFILTEEKTEEFLKLLEVESLDLFYTKELIEYGALKSK